MELLPKYGSFINGSFVETTTERIISDYNPSNGELLAQLLTADIDCLEDAVTSAQNAFKQWRHSSKIERAKVLNAMADIMDENASYLAGIEARDVGKPIGEAEMQMGLCSAMYRYFAAAIIAEDEVLVSHDNGSLSAVVREPLGIVSLILPWNAPAMLLSWKLAPALATGNCVIIKPATAAPLVILELARLWKDIIPAGVLSVLIGSAVGDPLLNHPGIAKFSFTGSTEVGSHIGEVAGRNIVPCTLELGGKSANIIFADAQLDRALQLSILGVLASNGEVCVAGSRLFVHEDIYDSFLEQLKEKFEAITIGDPTKYETQMGPAVNEGQMKSVLEYIEIGKNEGARLVCGGNRVTGGDYDKGFFIAPTIFADVDNSMRIAREEIFGPVLTVLKFSTEEEVIAMANDSEYGLGAGVWTSNLSRAMRVSRALEAGTVWVNDYLTSTPGNPFGGYKKSGIGREVHKLAMQYYTNVKNICFCGDEGVPPIF